MKAQDLATGGPVAQWITHLTTDQKIPGSTPGWLALQFFCISLTPLQTADKIAFQTVFVVIVVPLFVCFFTDVL